MTQHVVTQAQRLGRLADSESARGLYRETPQLSWDTLADLASTSPAEELSVDLGEAGGGMGWQKGRRLTHRIGP